MQNNLIIQRVAKPLLSSTCDESALSCDYITYNFIMITHDTTAPAVSVFFNAKI